MFALTSLWQDKDFACFFNSEPYPSVLLGLSLSRTLSSQKSVGLTFQKYRPLHSAFPPIESCVKAISAFQHLLFLWESWTVMVWKQISAFLCCLLMSQYQSASVQTLISLWNRKVFLYPFCRRDVVQRWYCMSFYLRRRNKQYQYGPY